MRARLNALLLGALTLPMTMPAASAEPRAIQPAGMRTAGPYSPGILGRSFLYVSGQGAANAAGQIPSDRTAQWRNVFENVRTIVTAAGLTMEHVVYVQAYMTGGAGDTAFDSVFREYFLKAPPAVSAIGVAALPGTPVEMNAVAVRDLASKKPIAAPAQSLGSAAVVAADRIYVAGAFGVNDSGKIPEDPAAQVRLALANMEKTLQAAGAGLAHLVFVNPYLTAQMPMGVMNDVYASKFEFGNTPARATIQVSSLAANAAIQFTGIAVTDLAKRQAVRPKNMPPSPTASPCVFAGDTLFCSAKSGFIPGPRAGIYAATIETQLRQTMRNLLDGLEEAGLAWKHTVASNVYLDNLSEFSAMNSVYAEYFEGLFPARTTAQQLPPAGRDPSPRGVYPTLEQISIIAER